MRSAAQDYPRSRAALLSAIALSLGIAALVCGDPFAAARLHLGWLEWFPFALTACVSLALAVLALLVMNGAALWTRKEIVAAVAMFFASQMIGLNLMKLDPLEMVTIPALLLWLAPTLTGQLRTVRVSGSLMLMGGFVFFSFLALVDAWPLFLVVALAALLVKFLDYFLLTQFIRTERTLRASLNGFMTVAVLSSVAGIVQVLIHFQTGIVLTLADTRDNLFKATPFGPMLRATAFCPKPQHLSGFLLVALPLLLFAAFEPGRRRRTRALILSGATITCAAIVLTLAIGAWITMVLVLLLFVYLRWPSRAIHITAVLALVVIGVWASGLFAWAYTRYLAHSGILSGGEQRVFLMGLAFEKLARNPWIGVGPRQFFRFTGNYRQFPVHDAYLQAATEAGLAGGILYVAILGYAGVRLVHLGSHAVSQGEKRTCRMLLLALFALFWNGLSEPTYDHSNTWISLGLLEGAILTLGHRPAPAAAAVTG